MPNTKLRSLSVVVAAYNEEGYIFDCIRALQQQDYPGEFEITVVDNGSSDRTPNITRELGAKVIFEPKRGVSYALIAGSSAAKGEVLVFTDADTRPAYGWLSRINNAFNQYQDLAAVGGPFYFYDSPKWANFVMKNIIVKIYVHFFYKREQGLPGSNMAVRNDFYVKVGGFEPGFNWGQDMKMGKKVSGLGRVVFDPDMFVWTSFRRFQGGHKNSFLKSVSFLKELIIGLARMVLLVYFNKNFKPQKSVR